MRELPHPLVDEGDQRAERLGITLRPPPKEVGDVVRNRQNVCGKSQGDGRKVDIRDYALSARLSSARHASVSRLARNSRFKGYAPALLACP